MMESAFDRFVAFFALLFLLPLFLVIALAVVFGSRGGAFYVQQRVGRGGKLFGMFKFRSMRPFADKAGKLTIGHRDPRVTRVGYTLRKYKVDELPQLINVLIGDMSIVGPRPEVPDYVAMYNAEQRKVLDVKPGITDYASLQYFHESELLAKSADPQRTYIEEVMPAKLKLNLAYIKRRSLAEDLKIMGLTLVRIFK